MKGCLIKADGKKHYFGYRLTRPKTYSREFSGAVSGIEYIRAQMTVYTSRKDLPFAIGDKVKLQGDEPDRSIVSVEQRINDNKAMFGDPVEGLFISF